MDRGKTQRDRGKALEAPGWWLAIAREKVGSTKGLIELGRELARLSGRSTPWSHTVLSRFANGAGQPTQELAFAISTYFGIPRPFYVPRDLDEARAMQAIADLRVPPSMQTSKFTEPVRIEREREHEAQLRALEEESRQRGPVSSKDGTPGSARRRGPRGVHRSR